MIREEYITTHIALNQQRIERQEEKKLSALGSVFPFEFPRSRSKRIELLCMIRKSAISKGERERERERERGEREREREREREKERESESCGNSGGKSICGMQKVRPPRHFCRRQKKIELYHI